MTTTNSTPMTALDELVNRVPALDPAIVEQARQTAELLRRLGLFSTEPTEAFRPFTRRFRENRQPAGVSNWTVQVGVQFRKVR